MFCLKGICFVKQTKGFVKGKQKMKQAYNKDKQLPIIT